MPPPITRIAMRNPRGVSARQFSATV